MLARRQNSHSIESVDPNLGIVESSEEPSGDKPTRSRRQRVDATIGEILEAETEAIDGQDSLPY
jgi:hypothetical protein